MLADVVLAEGVVFCWDAANLGGSLADGLLTELV